jgi:hypothetical protein
MSISSLPPSSAYEFWESLHDEFDGRTDTDELKSLVIRWSPYLGYWFIDLLHEADPGLIQDLRALMNKTAAWLPQDGLHEPWATFLNGVRKSDPTTKNIAYEDRLIPARKVRAERRELKHRQKLGADPGAVKFIRYDTTLSISYPFWLALAFGDLGDLKLTLCSLDVLFENARSFTEKDMRIAHFNTIQIGDLTPASRHLGRVLARFCRKCATAPAGVPESDDNRQMPANTRPPVESPGQETFDLNRPPFKEYKHQEYPRLLYHHLTGETRIVQDAAERQKRLDEGWSTDQYPRTVPLVSPEPTPARDTSVSGGSPAGPAVEGDVAPAEKDLAEASGTEPSGDKQNPESVAPEVALKRTVGRPNTTGLIYEHWVKRGKPDLNEEILDELAEHFYRDEFAQAQSLLKKPTTHAKGVKLRKKTRDRIRKSIKRGTERASKP